MERNDTIEKEGHQYKEAFCLMLYRCDACNCIELLWNSRNGVTPFCVRCRQCPGGMTHANWELDKRMPNYKPHTGQRVFVDLTEEKCRKYTAKKVDAFWNDGNFPMSEMFATKEEGIEALMKDFSSDKGEPDIIVWEDK